MDKEDWFILFAPGILYQIIVWSVLMNMEVNNMNIFGVEVHPVIVGSVITGLFAIVGILLKHFIYDRKQYKHLLSQLGDFEQRSLKSMIGEDDEKSLIKQHNEIIEMLSKEGLLAEKVDSVSEMLKAANVKQKERYLKFKKQNINIMNTLSDLEAFLTDWEVLAAEAEQLRKQVQTLQREKAELQALYEKVSRKNPGPIITPPTGRSR